MYATIYNSDFWYLQAVPVKLCQASESHTESQNESQKDKVVGRVKHPNSYHTKLPQVEINQFKSPI